MNDLIHGVATNIIDAKTFQMNITWKSPKNRFIYNPHETIFIDATQASELYGYNILADSEILEWKLRGRIVKCDVRDRDSNGKLVCAILGVY
jgi:hypothetical protein